MASQGLGGWRIQAEVHLTETLAVGPEIGAEGAEKDWTKNGPNNGALKANEVLFWGLSGILWGPPIQAPSEAEGGPALYRPRHRTFTSIRNFSHGESLCFFADSPLFVNVGTHLHRAVPRVVQRRMRP